MPRTSPRQLLTNDTWTAIADGPVTAGAIQPMGRDIWLHLKLTGVPTSFDDGVKVDSNKVENFTVETGETLYARADTDDVYVQILK